MWRRLNFSFAYLLDFMNRRSFFSYSMIASCGGGGAIEGFLGLGVSEVFSLVY